ncbi:MAG: hypothetical protein KAR83_02325, partial [Thermodesulfovibrionales bacterium]|nr:hypothetical protein [Thermodesulfovibrionales bacterium]
MVRKVLILSVLSILLSANLVWGATFNVTTPADFQTALNTAASNGQDDTINVAAGDYEPASTLTYAPTLASAEDFALVINGAGAGLSILNGLDIRQILEIYTANLSSDTNSHLTVKGIAFRNGSSASTGSGLYIETTDANITIEGAEFLENASTASGGGAFASSNSGTVAIINSTFTGNTGNWGGGAYAESGSGSVAITNSTFTGNTGSNAGGSYAYAGGTVAISDSTFTDNTTSGSGGGAYAQSSSGSVAIT